MLRPGLLCAVSLIHSIISKRDGNIRIKHINPGTWEQSIGLMTGEALSGLFGCSTLKRISEISAQCSAPALRPPTLRSAPLRSFFRLLLTALLCSRDFLAHSTHTNSLHQCKCKHNFTTLLYGNSECFTVTR